MRREDVNEMLRHELADHSERLQEVERALSQMYTSLPKNEDGKVGHQGVRYALHRYFINNRGWFIRGLEPNDSGWTPQRLANGELPPAFVKEWIPSYLQDTLENTLGNRGVALHELAAMAAALEDLIHKEVKQRLEMVYHVLDVPTVKPVQRAKADDVLMTYFMTFLLANNVTAKDRHEMETKRMRFKKRYAGFEDARVWYEKTLGKHLGSGAEVDFAATSAAVEDIGASYHTFNDLECNDLRATLRKMESRRPGRVRLSNFYNMSRFTHWRFIEKAEYLRTLGALDETDPKNPSVIIANYVMGRQNCLEATNLYAICCRNACEDLMAHLEEKIGTSSATASRIAALVAELPSVSVQAPRTLDPVLLSRLEEIEKHHEGQVPLHGRLFSQWMHHAYPLECPFPHELGTINPQTVDEWMRDSGHTSAQTSEEDRKRVVENDVCAVNWEGKVECGEETTDLPWNLAEELITGVQQPRSSGSTGAANNWACMGLFLLGIALLFAAQLRGPGSADYLQAGQQVLSGKLGGVLAVLLFVSLAFLAGLLDSSVFALAFVGSLVFYIASLRSARAHSKGMLLPKV